ncbi:hypothetical protein ACJJTC_009594 [Scirpophaga incertulas]
MSKKPHVVDGEASESESEIEVGKSPEMQSSLAGVACVIPGEAPESDDDSKLSDLANPIELDPQFTDTISPSVSSSRIYTSLLHQKLWECNVSLRSTIEGLFKHTTELAVEKLTKADKGLLHVQENMRATNANLTLAKARLQQISAELAKANCGAAFPTVKIKQ